MSNSSKTIPALWIPPEIIQLKLPLAQRETLAKILALSRSYGYCFASNAFIAQQLGISLSSVSHSIASLSKKKLICSSITHHPENKLVLRRTITLNLKILDK